MIRHKLISHSRTKKINLKPLLSLCFFLSFSFYSRGEVVPFDFNKDWVELKSIIMENPKFLLIPEEDGGLKHSKKYFQLDFMETFVTKKDGIITGFVNFTRQPEKYCAFYYKYIGQEKTPRACEAYKKLHYLHMIAVSKDHTRKGLASELLRKAQSSLSQKPILIDILKKNTISQKFFQYKGFKFVNLRDLRLQEEEEEGSVYMLSRDF